MPCDCAYYIIKMQLYDHELLEVKLTFIHGLFYNIK